MQIVDLMLKNTINALKEKDIQIEINKSAKNYILEKIKDIIKATSDDFAAINIEKGYAVYSLNWWFMKSLKWLIAAILAVLTLFLWGCSSTAVTKYYPVSVPVACSVDIPLMPEYNEDTVITNLNILAYAEKLKSALKICKNGGLND